MIGQRPRHEINPRYHCQSGSYRMRACLLPGRTALARNSLHDKSMELAAPVTTHRGKLRSHSGGAYRERIILVTKRDRSTSAVKQRIGKFERASGGTVFLDEIRRHEPIGKAESCCGASEEGKITRVGGEKEIKVDVRVLAATNKDLMKEAGRVRRFSLDLSTASPLFAFMHPPLNAASLCTFLGEAVPFRYRYRLQSTGQRHRTKKPWKN